MALTSCPDCEKPVSDAAPTCPHCGRPNAAAAVTVVAPGDPENPPPPDLGPRGPLPLNATPLEFAGCLVPLMIIAAFLFLIAVAKD